MFLYMTKYSKKKKEKLLQNTILLLIYKLFWVSMYSKNTTIIVLLKHIQKC